MSAVARSSLNNLDQNNRALGRLSVVQMGSAEVLPEGIQNSLAAGEGTFVAASPEMQKVRAQVHQIAGLDIPVLLLGESGTGKEVVARLIHRESCRAHRTFMRVNCAALPAE